MAREPQNYFGSTQGRLAELRPSSPEMDKADARDEAGESAERVWNAPDGNAAIVKEFGGKRFPVVEIFGPTIQGEGPEVGTRVAFVRFGGCDYRCTWCDTKEAVLPELVRENIRRMTAEEIVADIEALNAGVPLILLSGGNPALHELGDLVNLLHDKGYRVSIETQGSTWKEWMRKLDHIVVSPKPPSAGYGGALTWNAIDHFYKEWTGKGHGNDRVGFNPPMTFKVPCYDERDVSFAGAIADQFPLVPMFLSVVTRSGGLDGTFVWDQPYHHGNDTIKDVLDRYEQIIEFAHKRTSLREARIIPQMHYLIWGAEKGR